MSDDSDRLEAFIRSVHGGLEEPAAFFEETLDELEPMRASAPKSEIDAIVAGVRAKLFPENSLGTLFRLRREKLSADLEDAASAASWDESDLADLERDHLDLSTTPASKIAALLIVLRMPLDSIRDALTTVAREHLAVLKTPPGTGPVFGRTRKGVSPERRRAGLSKGLGEIDVEATSRAAAAYIREIEEAIEEHDA